MLLRLSACAFLSVTLAASFTPSALAAPDKTKAPKTQSLKSKDHPTHEDFDKSVTTGSTVTFEPADFCSDFQKIKAPDADKVQSQCGESMASYVRFADEWVKTARGSGEKSQGCRALGQRYSELEQKQAELQSCGASCDRQQRALYRELSDENKLAQKNGRQTPTARDVHARLVDQAKRREAAVQSNGKAYCEQQFSNAKHSVELVKLGYEQILVNYGELAEAVLSDMKGGSGVESAGTTTTEGAGTGMSLKSQSSH